MTISYTDLLQTLDERQHSLMQRYAFTCCCERCLDDSPIPGDWFLDAVAADGTLAAAMFDMSRISQRESDSDKTASVTTQISDSLMCL